MQGRGRMAERHYTPSRRRKSESSDGGESDKSEERRPGKRKWQKRDPASQSKIVAIAGLPSSIQSSTIDDALRATAIAHRFSPPNSLRVKYPDFLPTGSIVDGACVAYVDFPSLSAAQAFVAACPRGVLVQDTRFQIRLAPGLLSELRHRQLDWVCVMCEKINRAKIPACVDCHAGRIADCLVVGVDGRQKPIAAAVAGVVEMLPVPDHEKMRPTTSGGKSYFFDAGSGLYYDPRQRIYFNHEGRCFVYDPVAKALVLEDYGTQQQNSDAYRPAPPEAPSQPLGAVDVRNSTIVDVAKSEASEPKDQATSIADILAAAKSAAQASRVSSSAARPATKPSRSVGDLFETPEAAEPMVFPEKTRPAPTPTPHIVAIAPPSVAALAPSATGDAASAAAFQRNSRRQVEQRDEPRSAVEAPRVIRQTEEPPPPEEEYICFVCLRQFPSNAALECHCEASDIHKQNLQLHEDLKDSEEEEVDLRAD